MNKTITDLNSLYNDSEEVDKSVYAEMRTNVLLVAGDHYAKKSVDFTTRNRESGREEPNKIRLTQNHIQRLSKIYVNAITSLAPGVTMEPANKKELQDQKAADLHKSVWENIKKNHKIRGKIFDWASDYVNIGEVAVKIFWDWQKGTFKGYEQKQKVNEETGELEIDPMTGQPVMEEDKTKPVWSGDLVFERVFGFNLFRPKISQAMEDSDWIGIRKMASIKDLQAIFAEDEKKLEFIKADGAMTYLVFDAHRGNYETSKDQIMLREFYFRPCANYPNGYFYITTQSGILWEGELPFGIFPIAWCGFEQLPTTPRAQSPIRVWKPFQVEINRVVSKMAEHQITLGDDKIVVSNNAKISSAGTVPGMRAYSVSGTQPPVVVAGRTGDQYLPYKTDTVRDMYQAAMVAEILEEKIAAQVDPYAMLLQSARWKAKFSMYSEKFEGFLREVAEISLELTRRFVREDELIPMIGRSEMVNVAEFKNSTPLKYQITIEPQSDDLETRMGKQLTLNHIIQFAGQNLDKEDLGKLFRQLPYLNNEELMSDLTLNYDIANNTILALERGEMPEVNQTVEATYMLKRLAKRMGEPDFPFLPPQVQQAYQGIKAQYEQTQAQQQLAIQRAQQGFIPTDGYLVTTQVYAPDPKNPAVTRPLKLPYSSILWLAKNLEAQGASQQMLEGMQTGERADLAQMVAQMGGGQPPAGPVSPVPSPGTGTQPMMFTNFGQPNPIQP